MEEFISNNNYDNYRRKSFQASQRPSFSIINFNLANEDP